MGSIEPYETAGGRRYRVLYRRPDRRQTQKRGFTTKRDAQLYLASIEVSKHRGAYIDPGKSRVTISEWVATWLATEFIMTMQSRDSLQTKQ